MLQNGIQQGAIVGTSVYTKDNGTVDVAIRLEFPGPEVMTAHVYITEKSKGMARAALKKCGFNPDEQDVWDLDNQPSPLLGNEVQVDVFDNEWPVGSGKFNKKAEIVIEKAKPDANKMKKATMLLREAKSADEEHEENKEKIIDGFPRSGSKPKPKEEEAPF